MKVRNRMFAATLSIIGLSSLLTLSAAHADDAATQRRDQAVNAGSKISNTIKSGFDALRQKQQDDKKVYDALTPKSKPSPSPSRKTGASPLK